MRVLPPPPWSLAVTVTGAMRPLASKFFRLSSPALSLAGVSGQPPCLMASRVPSNIDEYIARPVL